MSVDGAGSGPRRLRAALYGVETWLAALSLLLLLLLALAQILARNFFDASVPGAEGLVRHLVLYVTFFGAALATERDSHLKIDVIAAWLPESTLAQLRRPLALGGTLVCGLFTEAALRFWLDEIRHASPPAPWLPWLGVILPLGFGLLTLHFLLAAMTPTGPRRG